MVNEIRFPTAKSKEPIYEKKLWVRFNSKKTHTSIKKDGQHKHKTLQAYNSRLGNDLVNKKKTPDVKLN